MLEAQETAGHEDRPPPKAGSIPRFAGVGGGGFGVRHGDAQGGPFGVVDVRAGLETADQGADEGDDGDAVGVFLLGRALGGLLCGDMGVE